MILIHQTRIWRGKGWRQEWPRALAWPANACVEPCCCATWSFWRTPGLLFRCARAGPSLTIFDRRRQSNMARTNIICSQGRWEGVRAFQVREYPKVCGHKPRPDALSALVRAMVHHCCGLHFSGSQLCQGISTVTSPLPSPGACTACSSCVRVLCTFLRVPCPHLYVRQPACVGRYCLPMSACGACAGFLCTSALHLFACASPVPARVLCLALDWHTQLQWVPQPHR